MMLIVHYKKFSEIQINISNIQNIFSPRFARITVHIIANFMWDDLDEMIDFKR